MSLNVFGNQFFNLIGKLQASSVRWLNNEWVIYVEKGKYGNVLRPCVSFVHKVCPFEELNRPKAVPLNQNKQ